MSKAITAEPKARRSAERAVEHLVQGHGLDRSAVQINVASEKNTAGTKIAGADVEDGHEKSDTEGEHALAGKIKVSAQVNDATADKVVSSFETNGGTSITT